MEVSVKPLEWDGFRSGPYEISIKEGGIADLFYHFGDDEPFYIEGGYLTLVSMDDLKDAAQQHHNNRVMSSIEIAAITMEES